MAYHLRSALGYTRREYEEATRRHEETQAIQHNTNNDTETNWGTDQSTQEEFNDGWEVPLSRLPAHICGVAGPSTAGDPPLGAPLESHSSPPSITSGPSTRFRDCATIPRPRAGSDVPDRLGHVPTGSATPGRQRYKRRSEAFSITVDSHSVGGKQNFINTVLSIWNIIEYCVAEELFAKANVCVGILLSKLGSYKDLSR
ncbi:uncharacterized protein LOC126253429 [Schistocerca nitens]|uniref:uncharacterized protein LOC126253429 n=1 Tax=Schistocerca nitens TaxID=7011 RepID=UPI0021176924|nr:uncharacterized protein LOC126253429 [Schistocerca nitens]